MEAPATVATVRLCRPLGFLGRQDDALAWWNIYGVEREPEEETLARIVFDTLRAAAARGATPAPAWDEILALVPHDRPAEVDRLATVAALLT